jgi:hypothetical protein
MYKINHFVEALEENKITKSIGQKMLNFPGIFDLLVTFYIGLELFICSIFILIKF